MHPPTCQFICPSIYPSVHPSIHQSIAAHPYTLPDLLIDVELQGCERECVSVCLQVAFLSRLGTNSFSLGVMACCLCLNPLIYPSELVWEPSSSRCLGTVVDQADVPLLGLMPSVGTKCLTASQAEKRDFWLLPRAAKKINRCRGLGEGVELGRGLRWGCCFLLGDQQGLL